jgi:AcrR family transcriptional regulator
MQTKRKNASQQVEPVEERSRNGKYEAILRAAARVFAQSGYFNAKVSDVARTAGVADGTVYLYFKNKDDLLTSIFGWAMGEFINRARSEMAEIEDPREKLQRFAHLHFSLLEQERDIAIVSRSSCASRPNSWSIFPRPIWLSICRCCERSLKKGNVAGFSESSSTRRWWQNYCSGRWTRWRLIGC